ncbi:MAG: hypothetical protein INR71_03820, partial [Terriglobus roseus]|nr:hypothetical protein [Terriglobus roseus]
MGLEYVADSDGTGGRIDDIEGLDIEGKEKHLLALFPTQPESAISYTLKKCDESFGRAMDVLLNHVYFDGTAESEGGGKISRKGIDAFDESVNPQSRKKKGRKAQNRMSLDDFSAPDDSAAEPSRNHWQKAAEDVEFISSRAGISAKAAHALYNKHGASIPAAVQALADSHDQKQQPALSEDSDEALNIAMLASEFPSVPTDTIAALIRMAAPSTAKAHEL